MSGHGHDAGGGGGGGGAGDRPFFEEDVDMFDDEDDDDDASLDMEDLSGTSEIDSSSSSAAPSRPPAPAPAPPAAQEDGDAGNDASAASPPDAAATGGVAAGATTPRLDPSTVKRRAIQAVMKDTTLSDRDKGLQIQRLMDGRPDAPPGTDDGSIPGMGGLAGLAGPGGGTGSGGDPAHPGPPGSGHPGGQQPPGGGGAMTGMPGSPAERDAVSAMVTPGSDEAVTCVHYERRCFVVAPCCNQVFGCRVCHDEMVPAPGHGPMDRFAVREVVCKQCRTRQSSKTDKCINCGVVFADYHCMECNLWMSLSKKPFHCPDCGFCRVGGRESYRHCHQCCMCISRSVFDGHNCMKDKYKNNCPVCREDMFSSRQSPQDLPCGHAIHAHCFRKLAGFDYRCPICKKTVVSQASMAAAWAARARDIELQPMPSDLTRVVNIMCNDCETKSDNRSWHFLGVQCPNCSSFNTVVENLVSSGDGSGGENGGVPDAASSS